MLGVAGRKRIFMGAMNREEQKWEGLEGGGMNEEKCLGVAGRMLGALERGGSRVFVKAER